jgi:hypothetical protein
MIDVPFIGPAISRISTVVGGGINKARAYLGFERGAAFNAQKD